MSNAHGLSLWSQDTSVADIGYDPATESWSLAYSPAWKKSPDAYNLTPALPLHPPVGGYASSTVKRFLENLLPEGRALDIVVSSNGIAKSNIYGLIRALGSETTGAFRFLAADDTGDAPSTPAPSRPVSLKELDQRITDRDQRAFVEWDGQVRLSVAGYQDKLLVYVDGDIEAGATLLLPEYPLASTFILKPQPVGAQLPHMVINEHYCMSLARAIGLPAAAVHLIRTPQPVLAVQRFDREVVQDDSGTWVRRKHVIDACQASDLPVSFKYERNVGSTGAAALYRDGMSFEKLFGLLRHAPRKAADKLTLLRWALFQIAIGNCDAHGKNFSFFVGPFGLTTAPWYDLVSVSQYPHMSQELAMAYGDVFALEDITAFALADFAVRCDIDRRLLAREAERMKSALAKHAKALVQSQSYEAEEHHFALGIAETAINAATRLTETAKASARLPTKFL